MFVFYHSQDREKELSVLQEQLNLLAAEKNEDGNTVEILSRFFEFLDTADEEKVQHEDAIKELRGIISGKDEQVAHLTTKISELSLSQNEDQLEAATHRILLSFSNVFGQKEPQDGSSVSEKICLSGEWSCFLSAKYAEFYYDASIK